jgi:hypothetical protein
VGGIRVLIRVSFLASLLLALLLNTSTQFYTAVYYFLLHYKNYTDFCDKNMSAMVQDLDLDLDLDPAKLRGSNRIRNWTVTLAFSGRRRAQAPSGISLNCNLQ